MYPGVDLRVLEYAVVVADELHFTRAAEKLHIAQPSLSIQIRELESLLGTKLFDRTKQFVRVTAAGASFVREAKQALLHAQRAVALAKAASQPSNFALGYSPFVSRSFVGSVRRVFASRFADVHLSLTGAFAAEQLDQIRAGALDAGLVTLPLDAEALAVQPLLLEPLLVVLPERHKLSRGGTVRLRDLKRLPMIVVTRKLCPQLHDRIGQAFRRESFQPVVKEEVMTPAEAIAMILALAEQVVHQRGDAIGERVGIEIAMQGVVAVTGLESDLDEVLGAAGVSERTPEVRAQVALDLKDQTADTLGN